MILIGLGSVISLVGASEPGMFEPNLGEPDLPAVSSCLGGGVAEPIAVAQALDLVRRQNPRVIGAEQELVKAQAAESGATAAFLPQVTGSLQGEAFHTENPGATTSIGSTVVGGVADRYTNYPTVGANWNLYNGGKDLAAYRAAQAGSRASQADLAGQFNDSFSAVLTAYNDLRKAQLALAQQARALARRTMIVERAAQRVEHGAGTGIALDQARIARAQTERERLKACRAVLDKSAALSQAIGVRVTTGHVLAAAGPLPPPPEVPRNDVQIDAAIEADPSVVAAHERVREAKQKVDEARAGIYPTLAFVARYDWLGQNPEDYTHAWRDTSRNSYRYGFVLQQNLFPYAAVQTAIASAEADLTKTQAAYDEAYVAVQTKLRTALNAVSESQGSAESARQSTREAQHVEMLSQALYARGHADLDTVDKAHIDADQEAEVAAEADSDTLLNGWLSERALHPEGFAERLTRASVTGATQP